MKNLLTKITKLEEELHTFFGSLTFEEIDLAFGESLFGLDEDATEYVLDEIREEWQAMSLKEKYNIVELVLSKR